MTRVVFPFKESVEVDCNVFITARERGKIVARREGHNIFLNYGREWLVKLMSYSSFAPEEYENNDRIRYMGFGIGGTRQIAPAFADTAPLTDYGTVGSFSQTDTDPTVTKLERPVRVTGGHGPATLATDVWMGQVQAPTEHPTATSALYRRVFTSTEISYFPYASVPLSEIALFTSGADVNYRVNGCVAYDTFDTLSKTTAFELEVVWTLRIG